MKRSGVRQARDSGIDLMPRVSPPIPISQIGGGAFEEMRRLNVVDEGEFFISGSVRAKRFKCDRAEKREGVFLASASLNAGCQRG